MVPADGSASGVGRHTGILPVFGQAHLGGGVVPAAWDFPRIVEPNGHPGRAQHRRASTGCRGASYGGY
jgi:hypothetical protein